MSAPAFDIVADMERDIASAERFATAIAMLAETIGEQDGLVFQEVAYAIRDCCKALEERRHALSRLLHPSREEFERIGWPGDQSPD